MNRWIIYYAALVALAFGVMALETKGQAVFGTVPSMNTTGVHIDGPGHPEMPAPVLEPKGQDCEHLCAGYSWVDSANVFHCVPRLMLFLGMFTR